MGREGNESSSLEWLLRWRCWGWKVGREVVVLRLELELAQGLIIHRNPIGSFIPTSEPCKHSQQSGDSFEKAYFSYHLGLFDRLRPFLRVYAMVFS